MKLKARALILAAMLLGAAATLSFTSLGAHLYAQVAAGATLVQIAGTRGDVSTTVSTSATSASTITLTPNAGESVYVYGIDVENCAGASAVTAAAVTTITTTNLTGSPAWTIGSGVTAGLCTQSFSIPFQTGLKAQSTGTAVTFVLPTFATNQTIRLNVSWRSAP